MRGWLVSNNSGLRRVYVTRKLAFAVVLFAGALVALGANAHAAELVMFERPGCPWCKRWHTEIGPAYPLTTEGKAAPLRRHHIRDQTLAGIKLSRPVTVTLRRRRRSGKR